MEGGLIGTQSGWDELNGNIKGKKAKSGPNADLVDDKDDWEDEGIDENVADASKEPTVIPVPKPLEADLTPTVPPGQMEDEVL